MSETKSDVLLEVKNLHKAFDKHVVLNDVNTTVRKGDVIAIIGPSGCGKSTFLRSLNMLETPTGGHVLFHGTDLTDKSVNINQIREKIGMVFQHFNLFPNMTIRENICLAPVKLKLMTKEEASKKADELLERVGLKDKADTYPAMLSGGQKPRISIARIFLKNPPILILDEATSNVDIRTEWRIQEAMRALMRGKTVAEAAAELSKAGKSAAEVSRLKRFKFFSGNRPTNTIVIKKVDPYTLGMLVAMYEHKVFVEGVIWNIDSFDQMGVELGKQMALSILPELQGHASGLHDSSTRNLISLIKKIRK